MQAEQSFTEWAGFQPKQLEALEAVKKFKYTLYGGSRGGGKSWFLRWMAVFLLLWYYKKYRIKGIRVGLFCEDYPSLNDRQISKIEMEFPKGLGTFHAQSKEFRLTEALGGGIICFRNLDDISKYLSAEFAAVLVDELTRNERRIFDFLLGSMRWKGIKDPKFIGTTNPGGPGHAFCKKLWIDRDFTGEGFIPEEFTFIKSVYKDNKYIDQSYASQLASLPEKLRKAYMDGDWNVFAGQFFSEWREEIHTCDSFPIPESWPVVIGLDYGYARPSVAMWVAYERETDTFWVFDELSEKGLTYKQLAQKIRAREHKAREINADPAIFAKKDSPVSGDMEMRKELPDFKIYSANNDRVIGWGKLREHLRIGDNGRPKIKVFKTCRELIKNLPTLVFSEIKSKGEDLETTGLDDECLTAGTKILTKKGSEKIEDIKMGDKVITPLGEKNVLSSKMTKESAIVFELLLSNGLRLKGTGNHPIFLKNGNLKRLDSLRYNDIIDTWKKSIKKDQSSFLMEKLIICMGNIFRKMEFYCIELFGKSFLEKFQRVFRFTIKMAILLIMKLRILKLLISLFIDHIILKNYLRIRNLKKEFWNILMVKEKKQKYGIDQKMGENGIKSMEKNHGKSEKKKNTNVFCVGKVIGQKIEKVNFVQMSADLKTDERLALMILKRSVFFAGVFLKIANILKPRPARVFALRKCAEKEKVYNLSIEGAKCYYANKILVHNCDSLRYAIMYFKDKIVNNKSNSYDLGAKDKKIESDWDIFEEKSESMFTFD